MRDVMLDKETVGKRAGCAIVSIGAVGFDLKTGEIDDGFYMVINRESCLRVGLIEDPTTIEWWAEQSLAAQNAYTCYKMGLGVDLEEALGAFSGWWQAHKGARLWANGSKFDIPIIEYAFDACEMQIPWEYPGAKPNDRCYRTIKGLAPEVQIIRSGTHHHALEDAKCQAVHLRDIVSHLGLVIS